MNRRILAALSLVPLLLTVAACDVNKWDPAIPQTTSLGWHACRLASGKYVGCSEWQRCTRDHGCENVGDPNGPGSGDVDQNGSVAWPPSR